MSESLPAGRVGSDGAVRARRRWIVSVIAPLVTFVLGVLAQQSIQDWLETNDTLKLGLFLVAIGSGCVALMIAFQATWHANELKSVGLSLAEQTGELREALAHLRTSSGLLVTYVDDAGVGASYRRAAEMIAAAHESITFVDLWEPFDNYQTPGGISLDDGAIPARTQYYEAVRKAVENHLGDKEPFHRRVVQVPHQLLHGQVPFHIDPPFCEYLTRMTNLQNQFPLSCRVRIASALIRMHFIIIDRRHIIIPILSHDRETHRQTRYGALFFEDGAGAMYACFRQMYQAIDARSRPLEILDFGPLGANRLDATAEQSRNPPSRTTD